MPTAPAIGNAVFIGAAALPEPAAEEAADSTAEVALSAMEEASEAALELRDC